jgi:hypothetical protein
MRSLHIMCCLICIYVRLGSYILCRFIPDAEITWRMYDVGLYQNRMPTGMELSIFEKLGGCRALCSAGHL